MQHDDDSDCTVGKLSDQNDGPQRMISPQRSHDHRKSGVKHGRLIPRWSTGSSAYVSINCEIEIIHPYGTSAARGTLINRCRSRGKARMRRPISWRRSSRPRSPGRSKIKITANCSGTLPVSIAEMPKSAGLARSIADRSPFGVCTRRRPRLVDSTFPSHSTVGRLQKSQRSYRRTCDHPSRDWTIGPPALDGLEVHQLRHSLDHTALPLVARGVSVAGSGRLSWSCYGTDGRPASPDRAIDASTLRQSAPGGCSMAAHCDESPIRAGPPDPTTAATP